MNARTMARRALLEEAKRDYRKPGLAKAVRGFDDDEFVGPPAHNSETCSTFGCADCLQVQR